MLKNLFLLLKLGRFPFLLGGLLIFCFGVLLTLPNELDYFRFLLVYAPIFFAQLSVSYSNDYFDYSTDSRTRRSLISGGSGVLQNHPNLRPTARTIALSLILIAIILSILFVIFFQLPLLLFIFVCIGCTLGWFYSAPPLRFSYKGLGEIVTFLVVGALLPLTASFVTTNNPPTNNILIIPATLFYSIFFSLNVQIPDYPIDSKKHKRNITSTKGINYSVLLILLSTIIATIYLILLSQTHQFFSTIAALSILPLTSAVLTMILNYKSKKLLFHSCIINLGILFLFILLSNIYLLLYLGFI